MSCCVWFPVVAFDNYTVEQPPGKVTGGQEGKGKFVKIVPGDQDGEGKG